MTVPGPTRHPPPLGSRAVDPRDAPARTSRTATAPSFGASTLARVRRAASSCGTSAPRARPAPGSGVGTPVSTPPRDDFRVGDVLDFPDPRRPPPRPRARPARHLQHRHGMEPRRTSPRVRSMRRRRGLRRTLEAEFRMDEETRVVGVYTDAPSELPVAVYHLAEGEEERWVGAHARDGDAWARGGRRARRQNARCAWRGRRRICTRRAGSARRDGRMHAHIPATTADRDGGGEGCARGATGSAVDGADRPRGRGDRRTGNGLVEPRTPGREETRGRDNPKITCRTSDGRTNDRDGSLGSETVIIRRAIERARSKSRWTRRASVIDDRLALEVALARRDSKKSPRHRPARAPSRSPAFGVCSSRVFRDVSARHPPAIHQRS